MNNFVELPVENISKSKVIDFIKGCRIKRIGYNALIYSDCANNNYLVKIERSGKIDFLQEIYSMSILGKKNISPKLLYSYWCDEGIALTELVSDKDLRNKSIVEGRYFDDENYKIPTGVIIMEKIKNILTSIPYNL
jgi:hypothetical protein